MIWISKDKESAVNLNFVDAYKFIPEFGTVKLPWIKICCGGSLEFQGDEALELYELLKERFDKK